MVCVCVCYISAVFYLVDVELALASGQFSVAGGELANEVMTVKQTAQDENCQRYLNFS